MRASKDRPSAKTIPSTGPAPSRNDRSGGTNFQPRPPSSRTAANPTAHHFTTPSALITADERRRPAHRFRKDEGGPGSAPSAPGRDVVLSQGTPSARP